MTIRNTSIAAYREIQDNGLLSKRRWQTYDDLYHHGPSTSRDSEDRLGDRNAHRRLRDLEEWGVAEKVGEVTCKKTGHRVTLWDVNANLPRKPSGGTVVNPSRPPADDLDMVIALLRSECQKVINAGNTLPDDHPYVTTGKWLVYQKTLAK